MNHLTPRILTASAERVCQEDSPTSVYIVDANEQVVIGYIDKETGHTIVDSVNAFAEAEKRDV